MRTYRSCSPPVVAGALLVMLTLDGPLAPLALAATLQRCIVDGEVLFTDTACPDQTRGQPVEVETRRLGNLEDAQRVRRQGERLWLYKRHNGERAAAHVDPPAANPSSLDVINAIRSRELLDGMTTDEVIESWGPPTSTTEGSDGGMAWTYRGTDRSGDKHSRRIRFTDGVVNGWTKSRVRVRKRFDPTKERWLD